MRSKLSMPSDDLAGALFERACRYIIKGGCFMQMEELALAVEKGRMKVVKELVNEALEEGIPVKQILDEGLIAPMGVVGEKFRQNQIFVPEMLVAARAMSAGVKIIEPLFSESGVETIGTVVIGTVKGDLHDIGKNLVAMMMKGMGATVYDLGIDVPDEKFVEKAEEVGADIVALSALLTTTMPAIGDGRLALIPLRGSREVLSYEFECHSDGVYFVYIDAFNGEEVNILYVLDDRTV